MREKRSKLLWFKAIMIITLVMGMITPIDAFCIIKEEKINDDVYNSLAIDDNTGESFKNVFILPGANEKQLVTKDVVEHEVIEEIYEPPIELTIEQMIERACAQYNISYEITLAIAKVETGRFTSDAYIYGNNPGGLSDNEIPFTFNSIEEGVEAFVSNLSMNYFTLGLTTPELIGKKYCPANYDHWLYLVMDVMYHG